MIKGDTVYLRPVNNTLRRGCKKTDIVEGIIKSIGRKYVTVIVGRYEYKFGINDDYRQVSEMCADYELFFTKQDLLDDNERNELFDKISRYFGWTIKNKLSLDQLRRINTIINENE